jgi:hypothetical protein
VSGVVIRIDRVVVSGVPGPASRDDVATAVARELDRWLAQPGAFDQLRSLAARGDREAPRGFVGRARPDARREARPQGPTTVASAVSRGIVARLDR